MTHLEDFPDEILLETFQFISLRDLYIGFHDLNSRINTILRSVNGRSLTLEKPDDVHDPIVYFFASNISHLIIRHSSPVDFTLFPSLHSLKSLFPRDRQLQRLLRTADLPHLTQLTVGFMGIWDGDLIIRLCRRIFSNRYPKLRYCSLWPPAFDDDCLVKTTPRLTHVQLQEGNLDDLSFVLDACPNLEYLQILVSKFATAPKRQIHHSSLERLSVSFVRYDVNWLEKLDWLFSMVPNIKRLMISVCQCDIHFDQLARVLNQRLPSLADFKCIIHSHTIPIKYYLLKRYHSLFQTIRLDDIGDNETCSCNCEGFKLSLCGQKTV